MNALALPARAGLAVQLLTECSAEEIGLSIETLLELLDARDGDPDDEDGDEDCCPAWDDRGGQSMAGAAFYEGAGDPDDAEDSDEDCDLTKDGAPIVFADFPELCFSTMARDV